MSPWISDPALSSTAVLVAVRIGAETTVLDVTSLGAGVDGSSVTMLMPPAAVIVAWLPIAVPFGIEALSRTWKVTTTSWSAPPAPFRVPMATVSGLPGVRTSVGSSDVRLPGTRTVFAGMASDRMTFVASAFPVFLTVIV